MLRKRYSEFRGLYDIIRTDCPAAKMLSFPSKVGETHLKKRLKREIALDMFMQLVEMSCHGNFSEKLEDELDNS